MSPVGIVGVDGGANLVGSLQPVPLHRTCIALAVRSVANRRAGPKRHQRRHDQRPPRRQLRFEYSHRSAPHLTSVSRGQPASTYMGYITVFGVIVLFTHRLFKGDRWCLRNLLGTFVYETWSSDAGSNSTEEGLGLFVPVCSI
jgi:hypothetical protein